MVRVGEWIMLNIEKAKEVLEELARSENIPLEIVIRRIEIGIDQAIEDCRQRGDKRALKLWDRIPCVGEVPTPYELVAYLGQLTAFEYSILIGKIGP